SLILFTAYPTRDGRGPLPTELLGEVGDRPRGRAREYGPTTGRARRIGWFDGVAARFSSRLNGFTGIAVTKLDQLDEMATLKICVAYEADGRQIRQMPSRLEALERCRPVYEELPGWQTDTQGARSYEDLPTNAQNYLQRLSQIVRAPIALVGVGPDRA